MTFSAAGEAQQCVCRLGDELYEVWLRPIPAGSAHRATKSAHPAVSTAAACSNSTAAACGMQTPRRTPTPAAQAGTPASAATPSSAVLQGEVCDGSV